MTQEQLREKWVTSFIERTKLVYATHDRYLKQDGFKTSNTKEDFSYILGETLDAYGKEVYQKGLKETAVRLNKNFADFLKSDDDFAKQLLDSYADAKLAKIAEDIESLKVKKAKETDTYYTGIIKGLSDSASLVRAGMSKKV